METKSKTRVKASELIARLQKMVDEHGDLEVICDTQDGDCYNPSDIEIEKWFDKEHNVYYKFLIS